VTPNDTFYTQQPSLKVAKVDGLWERSTGRSDVVVAIIGTGVKADHPDLVGKLVPGFDFVNNNADVTPDGLGGGTAQAGIIGAASNNGTGITGICWACKIMPLDIHDEAADTATADRSLAAFNYAVEQGVEVIYLSYTYRTELPALTQAIKQAHAKGIVVVGIVHSSGASTADEVSFPATVVPEVISVTGTVDDDTLRSSANFGPKVDVAAPSNKIPTLAHVNNETGYVTYTSNGAAGAFVAGVAALLRSAYPQATATEIDRAITENTDTCCNGKITGGRVNALKAGVFLEGLYPSQPAPKAGDINGDGKVNISDLSALLTNWNSANAGADLNKDGTVNLTDLSILLTNWTR
jgi:subtilisin family serine protease